MKNKTKIKFIQLLLVLLALICSLTLEAFYFGPRRLRVTYQTIVSEEIPEEFDDFSIVFFTDTHYNAYRNTTKLEEVVATIQELQPDLILFGGDLIDHPANHLISDSEKEALIATLKQIEAPFGKYAVYGNHDLEGYTTREDTASILTQAGFVVLNNENIKIHYNSDAFLKLVAIDSLMLGHPDIDKAYQDVRTSDYSILLCHTPDIADQINGKLTDLVLAGHSHGHQVYLPFISSYFLPAYGTKYSRGQYLVNDTRVFVSNGVGTTGTSARLFATPEIMMFRLQHPTVEKAITTTNATTGSTSTNP